MNETLNSIENIINNTIISSYNSVLGALPESYRLIFNIFLYVVLISLYSIFIFGFYRLLAHKNILKLNLSRYNTSKSPGLNKFVASLLFLLEYIIILPIFVIFWFIVLAILLLLLSKDQSVHQILLIAAAVVGSVRVTSYFDEALSKDLAKLFPFTALIIFLLSPNFLEFSSVLIKLTQIPLFFNHIFFYLVFVVFFEIFIRTIYTIIFLFKKPEEQEAEEMEEAIEEEKE